ncbi:LacI family DNA-binding transcriptional regulator [Demequina oxidasica]|uniref:LacI family DNA-binding transcriptional regulator n=1 Tax=Demequina oxidasica TaxID=676199 RepID=UPI000782C9FD|nr:LacI family DNA-binding transcriptional regulator [Demequina oxidasica]
MENRPRPKMSDVARIAGVSVATVSKVVNGRYGVSKETFETVQRVIDELGYVGNLSATSLRSAKTNVLGILVASFEPYAAELLKGAASASGGSGYELLAHAGNDTHGWERRSLARMGGTLIDGAVVVTPTVIEASNVIPIVAVDPHWGPTLVPTVDSDGFGGGRAAAAYLLSLGHTRIAHMAGREDLDSARERERGYRDAMREAGVAVDDSLVRDARYDPDIALDVARELLTMPDRPTAIFAANDITALSAMRVAEELGLSVPGDVSIVGFDDVPEATLAQPQLTTVRQPLQAMGAEAMRMLLDILSGVDRETHVRMGTELIVRDSCGPAPDVVRTVESA